MEQGEVGQRRQRKKDHKERRWVREKKGGVKGVSQIEEYGRRVRRKKRI